MECIIYNETNVLWWIFWCSTLKASFIYMFFKCFSIWFLNMYNHSACDECREIMISAIYLYDFSLPVILTFSLDVIECYYQIMTSWIKIVSFESLHSDIVSINDSDTENDQSMWRWTHFDITDLNHNFSFGSFHIHYH